MFMNALKYKLIEIFVASIKVAKKIKLCRSNILNTTQ